MSTAMQFSPTVQRTAVAAGMGIGTASMLAAVLLLGPLASSILLAVVIALIWPLATVIKYLAEEVPYESPLVVACAAAGGVLALPGFVRLLGWGAAGIAVALGFGVLFIGIDRILPSGPRRRRRRFRRRPTPKYEGLVRLTKTQEVEDEQLIASLQCPLSIEELCSVWQETVSTLAHGANEKDRQAVAEVRRICLDEFERRNPDGFQRWLDAGAPGDPGTYLLPKPGE